MDLIALLFGCVIGALVMLLWGDKMVDFFDKSKGEKYD